MNFSDDDPDNFNGTFDADFGGGFTTSNNSNFDGFDDDDDANNDGFPSDESEPFNNNSNTPVPFDFNSFGAQSSGQATGHSQSSPDNPTDGFDIDRATQSKPSKQGAKDTKHSAILIVVLGIAIVLIVLIAARLISNAKDKPKKPKEPSVASSQMQAVPKTEPGTAPSTSKPNQSVVIIKPDSDENLGTSWKKFDTLDEPMIFNEKYADFEFEVEAMQGYVKILGGISDKYLVTKMVLTGRIIGLPGTYSLDVPYTTGLHLKEGSKFDVQVQLGTYKGSTVVGEIRY